jgi:predicted enzyme related to lactoylglutathione lyase
MSDARLRLVILAVDDVPRAVAFYRAAFAWKATVELPVYVEFELTPEMGVSIYERSAFAANTKVSPEHCPEGALTATELYLHVDDLDAAVARLREAGARELAPPEPKVWGDTAAYFADPDGNVIAVAVHTHDGAAA